MSFDDLPRGHYRCILADPPWHFRARTALQVGNWTSRRDAERHYGVMGVEDIKALPVREHSRKPDEAQVRIERYCDGPYLELFARTQRENWTCWGNKVGKFEAAA